MTYDFEKEHGFKPPIMVGWNVGLVLHKNIMSGTKSELIEVPEQAIELQKYVSCVGRIFHLGDSCFKGEKFQYHNTFPKVGDWVVFQQNTGPMLNFRGIDIVLTVDDAIRAIIEEPHYVTRD